MTEPENTQIENDFDQIEEVPPRQSSKKRFFLIVGVIVLLLAIAVGYYFAVLRYKDVIKTVTIELGEAMPPASVFLSSGKEASYTASELPELKKAGSYPLEIEFNGVKTNVTLIVHDTVAPTAQPKERTITIDETLEPLDLLTNIEDKALVALQWSSKPSFGIAGDYEAVVKIIDESGNFTLVKVPVYIRAVREEITCELGDPLPTAQDFLLVDRESAYIATDIEALTKSMPGTYEIYIAIDGTYHTSKLILTDTKEPALTLTELAVLKGSFLNPTQLVAHAEDETALTYTFAEAPDTTVCGKQEVTVIATDLAGNTISAQTHIVVADYIISRESSTDPLPHSLFCEMTGQYSWNVTAEERFVPDHVGVFEYRCMVLGESVCFAIIVQDTIAPQYVLAEANACTGYRLAPENFFAEIIDDTNVTVTYEKEPDWSINGQQEAVLLLTDEGGNTTRVESVVTIAPDQIAPTILGVKDRYCYVGEAVAYFSEASAVDNADPNPTLTVDSSQADIHTLGAYPVTYTATDADGNTSSVTVTFTFIESTVSEEDLEALVDEIFAEIMTPDMTVAQQAEAIFNYVYNHVIYVGFSDKTDWRSEAYRGITTGYGDCFTIYSVEYLLLSHIDCEVLSIERYGWAGSEHYWCLVNLGTGWYHFDAISVGPEHYRAFMKTDAELRALSNYYWDYNEAVYPEVATEKFRME